MSALRGPTRLAEGDMPELAAAIIGVRAERASAAMIDSLARRLEPQIASPVPAGSSASAGKGIASWGKAVLGLGALAAVLALVVPRFGSNPSQQHASPASRREPYRPIALPVSADGAREVPAAQDAPAQDAIERQPARPAAPAARAVRARPQALQLNSGEPVVTAAPDPEAELALLERARAALSADPTAALALLAEHERAYPHGVFAQEREVLAIEALLARGERSAARARAARFVRAYPESAHARRVRGLLELVPEPQP